MYNKAPDAAAKAVIDMAGAVPSGAPKLARNHSRMGQWSDHTAHAPHEITTRCLQADDDGARVGPMVGQAPSSGCGSGPLRSAFSTQATGKGAGCRRGKGQTAPACIWMPPTSLRCGMKAPVRGAYTGNRRAGHHGRDQHGDASVARVGNRARGRVMPGDGAGKKLDNSGMKDRPDSPRRFRRCGPAKKAARGRLADSSSTQDEEEQDHDLRQEDHHAACARNHAVRPAGCAGHRARAADS